MVGNSGAAGRTPARIALSPRLIVIAVIAVLVIAVVAAVVIVKLQSPPRLDLTGTWVAHQGATTVNLTLTGAGADLSGKFEAQNAPIPISGTLTAHVTGTKADVTLNALGGLHTGTCQVSNTKLSCVGTGSDTSTLTLTFTRP